MQEITNKIIEILRTIYNIEKIKVENDEVFFNYKKINTKISTIKLENGNILIRFHNENKYRSFNISDKNNISIYIQSFIKECLK